MDRPNIVCISIDSLRMDYTSLLGSSDYPTTPFLRSLATESTVFQTAITPSIWTLPVHTSVFTGLYPPEHGIYTGDKILGDHPTFAQLLAESGYSTNAFYKNGWLDTAEILRGFESTEDDKKEENNGTSIKSRIAETAGSISPKVETLLRRGYSSQRLYRHWKFGSGMEQEFDKGGRDTINQAISSIDDTRSPFCWFIHLNDAHHKYAPPYPYHQEFTDRTPLELVYNHERWQYYTYHSRTNRLETTIGERNPPKEEVDTFKNLYRGTIRYCDSLIEDLIDSLKSANKWNNTILIVFGDHGDGFGEDGVFGHHFSLHDSLIHVPLIVRTPDSKTSEVVKSPVSLIDIYPTILELTGISGPSTEGINLLSETRDYAYTYYDISEHDYYTKAPQKGIEKDRLPPAKQYGIYKSENERVIYYPDLMEHKKVGQGTESLLERLRHYTDQLERIDTSDGEISDEVAERLEQMGYLRE